MEGVKAMPTCVFIDDVSASLAAGHVVEKVEQLPRLLNYDTIAYVLYTSGVTLTTNNFLTTHISYSWESLFDIFPLFMSMLFVVFVCEKQQSTGKPKGVMVREEGVVNVVHWFADQLRLDHHSKVLGLTTVCFDISVLEIFMPLTRGASLVLVKSRTQKDPFRLLDMIKKHAVNVVQATPTTYEMMLATGWTGDTSIDFLVTPPPRLNASPSFIPSTFTSTSTSLCSTLHHFVLLFVWFLGTGWLCLIVDLCVSVCVGWRRGLQTQLVPIDQEVQVSSQRL